jgi:hypothetical protein
MPTRIKGMFLSGDGKTPIVGAVIEAYDPGSGTGSGTAPYSPLNTATTDSNGGFTISGLEDRSWVARKVTGGSGSLQLVKETWVEDEPHGQLSTLQAHGITELRGANQIAYLNRSQSWTDIQHHLTTQVFEPTTDVVAIKIQPQIVGGSGNLLELYDAAPNLLSWCAADGNFHCSSFVLEGSAKTLQIIPAGLTANRIVTLPDATGTVTLTTAAQTVSNKTLSACTISNTTNINCNTANGVTFRDNTDTTKNLRFDLSQITAANVRIHTMTDGSGVVLTDSNVLVDGDTGDILSYEGDILVDMAA